MLERGRLPFLLPVVPYRQIFRARHRSKWTPQTSPPLPPKLALQIRAPSQQVLTCVLCLRPSFSMSTLPIESIRLSLRPTFGQLSYHTPFRVSAIQDYKST